MIASARRWKRPRRRCKPGDVLLLENVRYYNEEEANDPAFAEKLAAVADIYVNDAFGAAHRAHASTEGVARVIAKRGGQCAAGLLMERELKFLGEELENPARPFVVILGGAKVSDKIKVIDRLLEKADTILIGGAMAYTFKLAQGSQGRQIAVGTGQDGPGPWPRWKRPRRAACNFCCRRTTSSARRSRRGKLNKKGKPIIDIQNPRIERRAGHSGRRGRAGHRAGDGEELRRNHSAGARPLCGTGRWGCLRTPRFAEGTNAVARAVAEATPKNGAKSIIGGGDSVKALNQAGLGDKVTFMSTGGGASLEFLEGKVLPGVAALSDK